MNLMDEMDSFVMETITESRAWVLMVSSEGSFGFVRPQKLHLRVSLLPSELVRLLGVLE